MQVVTYLNKNLIYFSAGGGVFTAPRSGGGGVGGVGGGSGVSGVGVGGAGISREFIPINDQTGSSSLSTTFNRQQSSDTRSKNSFPDYFEPSQNDDPTNQHFNSNFMFGSPGSNADKYDKSGFLNDRMRKY